MSRIFGLFWLQKFDVILKTTLEQATFEIHFKCDFLMQN